MQHAKNDPGFHHQQRNDERCYTNLYALSNRQCSQPAHNARASISVPKSDDKAGEGSQEQVAHQRRPPGGGTMKLAEAVAVGSTSMRQVVANPGNEEQQQCERSNRAPPCRGREEKRHSYRKLSQR